MTTDLGTFEGKEVIGTPMVVRKAGDGLSKAMDVAPEVLHHGERVFVVLQCNVSRVTFVPNKDNADMFDRVQVLDAELATFVDEKVVAKALASMRAKQEAAKQIKGQMKIEGTTDGDGDEG